MIKRFLVYLKSYDKFGRGVSVNYRGAAKFNTLLGAFVTFFNLLFASEFIFVTLYSMYIRDSDITST